MIAGWLASVLNLLGMGAGAAAAPVPSELVINWGTFSITSRAQTFSITSRSQTFSITD